MNPQEIIDRALLGGQKTLDEAEAKLVLAEYGVPVVQELTTVHPSEAADLSQKLGFPLVLKGLGPKLTHKTERGLVRLGLTSPQEVEEAAKRMAESTGPDLEGFLLQPQVSGRREFVAGLFRDEQFGPVVMFGLGGIMTEALGDVVFRLAPFREARAEYMLSELKAASLLGEFRGERPADRQALINTLTGLSRLAIDHPEVAEVDINPLLVTPDGRVVAVDALMVLGRSEKVVHFRPPNDPARIGAIFHPHSIAYIGASPQFRKWGHMLFTHTIAGGFPGKIFLVNPKVKTIAGRQAYRSVLDIPDPVDLAVVSVPASGVMSLLPELAAKDIRAVVLVTSGFAETGPEGRQLEERLVEEARRLDILILGPNTMGLCNPYHKFHCLGNHTMPKPGPTAFVSQSGNMGVQLLTFAEQQGIGIRAFAGTGNEAMFTIEDVLDAFAVDNLSKTVLLYIESIKNGRRFFESARQLSRKKPVIILKGGRTQAGKRAAASHTGALASDTKVFDAACRQAGIILAEKPTDLLDLSAAFSSLPRPQGRRVAIMTLGGGWGVVTSDLCAESGLILPELSPELISRFDQLLPPYWSRANPIDLVGIHDPLVPVQIMDELLAWDDCDGVINLGILGRKWGLKRIIETTLVADPEQDPKFLDSLMIALTKYEEDYVAHLVNLMERHQKPILGVSLVSTGVDQTVYDVEGSQYKGIFFPTPERAVRALAEMCDYQDWLNREELIRK